MSTPQAKRRRLNDASTTLKKPFKSPFRTPVRPSIGSDPPSSDPPETLTTAQLTSFSSPSTTPVTATTQLKAQPTAAAPAPATPRFIKPPAPQSKTPTLSRPSLKTIPSKSSLTRELVQLRSELQILTQAHALATSTKDEDLQVLIDRWRTASRAAAEELFGSTRDRVNRMGGVGAWKAREKEAKERTMRWDIEERQAEREKMEEAREEGRLEDEVYDRYAEMAEEQEGRDDDQGDTSRAADDDSFTMDMMLKTLNIDLDLIGYNKEAQRWGG